MWIKQATEEELQQCKMMLGVENVVSSVIGVGLCFHSRSCKLFSIMYGRLMVCSQKSVLQKLRNGNATKISPPPLFQPNVSSLNFLQIEEGSIPGRDSVMGISEFRRLQLKCISDAYIY